MKILNLQTRNIAVRCLNWNRHFSTSIKMTDYASFETLKFENSALKKLPIDKETDNYTRQVTDAVFSKV